MVQYYIENEMCAFVATGRKRVKALIFFSLLVNLVNFADSEQNGMKRVIHRNVKCVDFFFLCIHRSVFVRCDYRRLLGFFLSTISSKFSGSPTFVIASSKLIAIKCVCVQYTCISFSLNSAGLLVISWNTQFFSFSLFLPLFFRSLPKMSIFRYSAVKCEGATARDDCTQTHRMSEQHLKIQNIYINYF